MAAKLTGWWELPLAEDFRRVAVFDCDIGTTADAHVPTLRAEFLDYCDDLNHDATFEPARA